MVTQVSFGNFFQLNGKTVLGGAGGSGIDTQSLINTLVQARSTQATQDQDQIKINDGQSSALTQFQSLLSNFQAASDALRNPPGVGNAADNVFQFTTGSVSANGTNYLSVSTEPGAVLQPYIINNITQLASAATQTSEILTLPSANDPSAVTSTATAGKLKAGTLTFAGGGAITLNAGDSLSTVAAKFNSVSNTSGIAATVIQVDSTHFELQFTATNTGTNGNFDLTNSTTVTDPSGALGNIGLGVNAAQNTGLFDVADANTTVVSAGGLGITSQFAPGTITFAGGATVTLSEGDSLTTVAQAFNAVSNQTGIAATVVNVSPGEFKLAFTAQRAGASSNFDLTDIGTVTAGGAVLAGVNLAAATAGTTTTKTAGTDAIFKINGLSIERQSNNISDVISGVTFNLAQTTSNDPNSNANITVAVQPDTTTVQNAIVTFVNAYNAIKTFAAQQTQLNSDGTYATAAVLAGNQSFRAIVDGITNQVTAQVAGISSGPASLAALGITLTSQPASSTVPQVDNVLTVNDGQLTSLLSTNFSGVAKAFGFFLTSDNPNLTVFSETNALTLTNFTLNIDPFNHTFTADPGGGDPLITLTATLLPGSGYALTAPSGSALEGMVLIYASTSLTATTIHASTTQGIASQLYNSADSALNSTSGTLPLELTRLKASDTQLNKDIANVNAQVALYQQQLVQQFAALEKAVSSVNQLLSSLAANDAARIAAASG